MKRREWTFEKPANELRDAARSRVDYHDGREQWWIDERVKAEEAVAAVGFQVRSHAVTGGERHEVVIDATLTKRLGECEAKIRAHRAKADEYSQWVQALEGAASSGKSFTLDHDDWIFFFGVREDEE